MRKFMPNLLIKQTIEIKYSRNSLDPENFRCGLQQPHNFFSVFVDCKIGRFNAEELAVTGEEILRLP